MKYSLALFLFSVAAFSQVTGTYCRDKISGEKTSLKIMGNNSPIEVDLDLLSKNTRKLNITFLDKYIEINSKAYKFLNNSTLKPIPIKTSKIDCPKGLSREEVIVFDLNEDNEQIVLSDIYDDINKSFSIFYPLYITSHWLNELAEGSNFSQTITHELVKLLSQKEFNKLAALQLISTLMPIEKYNTLVQENIAKEFQINCLYRQDESSIKSCEDFFSNMKRTFLNNEFRVQYPENATFSLYDENETGLIPLILDNIDLEINQEVIESALALVENPKWLVSYLEKVGFTKFDDRLFSKLIKSKDEELINRYMNYMVLEVFPEITAQRRHIILLKFLSSYRLSDTQKLQFSKLAIGDKETGLLKDLTRKEQKNLLTQTYHLKDKREEIIEFLLENGLSFDTLMFSQLSYKTSDELKNKVLKDQETIKLNEEIFTRPKVLFCLNASAGKGSAKKRLASEIYSIPVDFSDEKIINAFERSGNLDSKQFKMKVKKNIFSKQEANFSFHARLVENISMTYSDYNQYKIVGKVRVTDKKGKITAEETMPDYFMGMYQGQPASPIYLPIFNGIKYDRKGETKNALSMHTIICHISKDILIPYKEAHEAMAETAIENAKLKSKIKALPSKIKDLGRKFLNLFRRKKNRK